MSPFPSGNNILLPNTFLELRAHRAGVCYRPKYESDDQCDDSDENSHYSSESCDDSSSSDEPTPKKKKSRRGSKGNNRATRVHSFFNLMAVNKQYHIPPYYYTVVWVYDIFIHF